MRLSSSSMCLCRCADQSRSPASSQVLRTTVLPAAGKTGKNSQAVVWLAHVLAVSMVAQWTRRPCPMTSWTRLPSRPTGTAAHTQAEPGSRSRSNLPRFRTGRSVVTFTPHRGGESTTTSRSGAALRQIWPIPTCSTVSKHCRRPMNVSQLTGSVAGYSRGTWPGHRAESLRSSGTGEAKGTAPGKPPKGLSRAELATAPIDQIWNRWAARRVRSACDILRQVTAIHGHEQQTGSPVEQTDLDVFRLLRGSSADSRTGGQGRDRTAGRSDAPVPGVP